MSDYMRPVVAMALPFTGTIAGAYFTQKNMDWYKVSFICVVQTKYVTQ